MGAFYAIDLDEIIASYNTHFSNGLNKEEADRRLKIYGPNVLEQKKAKSVWQILIEQFVSPIIWLLIVAGIIAFIFGQIPEGVAIFIVIVVNALIGFFMEWQALRSMDELRKMGRAKTNVIRGGRREQIDSAELVPGDLIYLEAGDLVTADARLTVQHNLAIKEAALTGESAQVSKHTEILPENTVLADRENCVFKGTVVTRGNGRAVVVATGNETELGMISALAQKAKKEATPLDKRLKALCKKLIWLTLILTFLILVIGVMSGRDWMIMIKTAIALAVAAIPEGLPVIATITLARGMIKLARKEAIVKTLEAVQTLGETNVIFTDKTGTLTENEMYLETAVFESGMVQVADYERQPEKESRVNRANMELLLTIGVLCNDSSYHEKDGKSSGDPIEIALLRSAYLITEDPENMQNGYPRIAEVPFDADIKMMGTLNRSEGKYLICVKGATEAVLRKCANALDEDGEEIGIEFPEQWLETVDDLAAEGYRVLSFAYGISEEEPDHEEFIQNLVFLGLGCFIDPARENVKEAMHACQDAGIKVVMVTGDHPETAGNIAEKVGLVENGRKAIKVNGEELWKVEKFDKEQKERLLSANIFARTNPSQKLDLVELYQKNNYIVGMTGDGVNDAPALKKADIGIAMGLRGTEAAKEVADIVLKDDSFSSIVLAIRQGRIIFRNIRIFVVYLLSCNLSEILVVGTASFLAIPLPLLPLQILFLNMVTDVFPALALGMSKGEEHIMKVPPRRPDEPIISKALWIATVSYGISMTIAVLGVEFIGLYLLHLPDATINNMTFYALILVQLWNVFNLPESRVSFFRNEVTKNKYVWMALLLSITIVAIAWVIVPAREALALTALKPLHWAIIGAVSLVPTLLIQFFKRSIKIIK